MDASLPAVSTTTNKAGWRRHALRLITPAFRIREERPSDVPARETLLDTSFGAARFTKTCERLREGRRASAGLSFVATAGIDLVGTVRLWDVEIGDRAALMLGPLAVDPAMRSAGIGRALIEHALGRARQLGHSGVFLVGDAPYYARVGFDATLTDGFVLPGPVDRERFLARELVPGGLRGAKGRIVGAGAFVADRDEQRGSRRAA